MISVSLTGLWTCTNGTLKSEDWEWANCLKIPDGDGDAECGALSRTVDCNTQDCPVDCVGNWSCGAWVSAGRLGVGGYFGERDCTYVVTRAANAYGNPCPHRGGDTKKDSRLFLCTSRRCGPRGASTCYNCDNLPF